MMAEVGSTLNDLSNNYTRIVLQEFIRSGSRSIDVIRPIRSVWKEIKANLAPLVRTTAGTAFLHSFQDSNGVHQIVAQASDAHDQFYEPGEGKTFRETNPPVQVGLRQIRKLPAEIIVSNLRRRRFDLDNAVESAGPGNETGIQLLWIVGRGDVDDFVDLM
jgi:hypothetical protein